MHYMCLRASEVVHYICGYVQHVRTMYVQPVDRYVLGNSIGWEVSSGRSGTNKAERSQS
jgi:hypothetical protein